jgi:hypothetical protein
MRKLTARNADGKGQVRYPVVLRHDAEFLFLGISPLLSNKNKLLRHYAKLATQTIARAALAH